MVAILNAFVFWQLCQATLPVSPEGFMPFQGNYWLWKIVGIAGLVLFQSRWVVQWLYSEKHGESRFPVLFWYQSIAGTLLLLLYSLRQQDSVFVIGYGASLIPCVRNLMLIRKKEAAH
jgi:lipid-A-disaccharide synthase-like uncharacterized protein